MTTDRKPLLLVISQVYVPDPASVGQHLADVAEMLADRGHAVRVLTSSRGYEDPHQKYPARELRQGVDVRRLPLSSFGKRSVATRLAGQLLFLAQAIVRGLFATRLAGLLVSTSPPMAGFAALAIAWVRRVPITYWVMDLNPDQAVALGKVSPNALLVQAMRWLNRRMFARAAAVVVLDRFMAERINAQYRVRGRMEVLPPWPHVEGANFLPLPLGEGRGEGALPQPTDSSQRTEAVHNPFRAEHGLADRFVVMYSGNHSPANPVTTLLEAALALEDDPRFVFLFIGGGLGKREVDAVIAARRPANIRSLPYQPLEQLQNSLSAADLHVVTLGREMVGVIHPCKIYGAMAVGRPVLVIGPRPSHAADLVDRHQIGWQVDHGNVAGTVATLQKIVDMPHRELTAIGTRAAEAVRGHYHKQRLCTALCELIERTDARKEIVHQVARPARTRERLEPVASEAP